MPVSIAPFVGGDIITASSVLERLDDMEKFVNGGISSSDLKSTAWVKTEHIAKPEFFASADKRFQGVSSDIHHRRRPQTIQQFSLFTEDMGAGDYFPIPSLSTSFYCHGSAVLDVYASFWAYETGGDDTDDKGDDNTRAALIKMFVDGTKQDSTQRRVTGHCEPSTANLNFLEKFHRRNHHVTYRHSVALTRGPHTVSFRIQMYNTNSYSTRDYAKVYIGTRSFVCNLQYK
tara:strand:+ start:3348 stop:4040 length:693 start_codon:yes stop_codon:yes gene_type:complete